MRAAQIETELTDSEYEDYLDELYGEVEVCGCNYSAGRTLREVDPTAFRCGKSDYESEQDSENPRYACGECGEIFEGDSAEDEAEECCEEKEKL